MGGSIPSATAGGEKEREHERHPWARWYRARLTNCLSGARAKGTGRTGSTAKEIEGARRAGETGAKSALHARERKRREREQR